MIHWIRLECCECEFNDPKQRAFLEVFSLANGLFPALRTGSTPVDGGILVSLVSPSGCESITWQYLTRKMLAILSSGSTTLPALDRACVVLSSESSMASERVAY